MDASCPKDNSHKLEPYSNASDRVWCHECRVSYLLLEVVPKERAELTLLTDVIRELREIKKTLLDLYQFIQRNL